MKVESEGSAMTLGERIAKLRKEHGWTQDILGEKVGVHTNHVSRWERDRMRPSTKALRRLADAFHVSYDDLLGNEQPPVPMALGGDQELLEKFQMVQELASEDRAVLYRMIDVLAMHSQMERVLGRQKVKA